MLSQENIPQYDSKIRECANFARWNIKKICKDIGPRTGGSEEELKAQEFMAKQLGSAVDEVKTEEFEVSPKAFFGWFKITGVLLTISTVLFILGLYIVTLILCVYVASMILFEFLFYKKYVDWYFPKATSHNTTCTRKPTGEVKRRIIFGGHSDSVFEWTWNYLGGNVLLILSCAYAAVGLGYLVLFTIIKMVQCGGVIDMLNYDVFSWLAIAFVPGYVMFFMYANFRHPVLGANDNLSGCMVAAGVLKFMEDNDIRFENTEVCCLFSGSEEHGLRGAKAWAKAHKKECEEVETMFVGLDTFRDIDDMYVYNRDMSGLVKHDDRCANLMRKAAANCDHPLKTSSVWAGASDAAATTQAGIPSCSLAAMNPGPPRYYHTRYDTADNLNLACIELGIKISVEAAFIFDKEGLKLDYD